MAAATRSNTDRFASTFVHIDSTAITKTKHTIFIMATVKLGPTAEFYLMATASTPCVYVVENVLIAN